MNLPGYHTGNEDELRQLIVNNHFHSFRDTHSQSLQVTRANSIPQFPLFDPSPDHGAAGPRWEMYVSQFKNLMIAMSITTGERPKAFLLHYACENVHDIFNTLTPAALAETQTVFDTATAALTEYFDPKKNIVFEEYQFRQAKQTKDKSIMAFFTCLKQLAKTCKFSLGPRNQDTDYTELCLQQGPALSFEQPYHNTFTTT